MHIPYFLQKHYVELKLLLNVYNFWLSSLNNVRINKISGIYFFSYEDTYCDELVAAALNRSSPLIKNGKFYAASACCFCYNSLMCTFSSSLVLRQRNERNQH